MYADDDELSEELFDYRPTTTRKLQYTGRLSLNRKLHEKQAVKKSTISIQNKSTNLPSNQNSEGSCEGNERTIHTILAGDKTVEDPALFEQNQTYNIEEKTHSMVNNTHDMLAPSHGDDGKQIKLASGFMAVGVRQTKTMSRNSACEQLSHPKIHHESTASGLVLSPATGNTNCRLPVGNGKTKRVSNRAMYADELNPSQSNTAQKSETPVIKLESEDRRGTQTEFLLGENECALPGSNSRSPISGNENGNGKRRRLLATVAKPVVSNFLLPIAKQAIQEESSSQNVSHLVTESFDQFETLEFQQNISNDIFLDLEEEVCYIGNETETKSRNVAHSCVNVVGQSEADRKADCSTHENEGIQKKLPVEEMATLPNCGKDELESQQSITTLWAGVTKAKNETSASAQKSANKKAWEGMMSMMRSNANATAKKPIRNVSKPVKAAVQTHQSKPAGGNNSYSATTASTASISSTSKGSRWKSNEGRPCPFYKKIPGTGFAVDAFNYGSIPGVTSYFLSHFHSDHYIGLKASFSLPIYCTSITASLVQSNIRVKSQFLHILPLNAAQEIGGVRVTALDANHCPGSAMLLFQMRSGVNILHVGDFRATSAMEHMPELCGLRISQLYLDTTYCDAKYDFPTQEDAVATAVELALAHLSKHPRTVIVCGTYLIGKEKLFMGVSEVLDCRIWTPPSKAKILRLLEDPVMTARLIDDPSKATVHVVSMQQLNLESLQRHLAQNSKQFSHILALKPSGWEHSRKAAPFTRGNITIAGVAYSEHSSFSELARFVKFIRPGSIIPTVNVGSAQSRQAMKNHFSTWLPSLR